MRKLGNVNSVVLFFSILFIQIILSDSLVNANESIRPSIDVAQYQDSKHNSYLEIYYSIPEAAMKYIPDETGKYQCRIVVDLEIHLNESLWTNKLWKIEKSIDDTSEVLEGSQLVDVLRYYIEEAGTYEISMHVKDMNQPAQIDSVRTVFEALEFSKEKVEISDIELATEIKKLTPDDATNNLTKNGYTILPSPTGIFGEGSLTMYYYFEAYNLMAHISDERYKTLRIIKDSYGNVVKGLGSAYRRKKRIYDSSIELGMMNVSTLPTGKYTLIYGIADDSESVLVSKEKDFFVYNPAVSVVESVENKSYGKLERLNEKELDDEFRRTVYLTTKEERKIFEALENVDGKRKFLYSVWAKPRVEYAISGPPFREEYLARARFADETYKSVFDPGWRSDRGRVFILYGAPSYVERFPSTPESLPYQTWTYDHLKGQARIIFVFVDRAGFNKYELIHSNLRGERRDTNWQQTIASGISGRNF